MKHIMILALFFGANAVLAESGKPDIEELIEHPSEFITDNSFNGLVFYIVRGVNHDVTDHLVINRMWSAGIPTFSRTTPSFKDVFEDAGFADIEPNPVLLLDLRSAEAPRFLRYKEKRSVQVLKRVAKQHGLKYENRENMYHLLANDYEVDAILNNEDELIILRPQRFRLLTFPQTVHFYATLTITGVGGRLRQVEVLSRAMCSGMLVDSEEGS